MTEPAPIASRLLAWAREHGRHDLPWQREVTPYRVWVSEIMLQQTQVATVIPYFERFMTSFPEVVSLADAPLDSVLAHWSGLGYYARARNLHKAAQIVRDGHGGRLPADRAALEALPGIGRSTAAAIMALAHHQPEAILDGNVKRVLTRYHAVPGWPGDTAVLRRLWVLAERHMPAGEPAAYTQAIMDLGATICTRSKPYCDSCPLRNDCQARLTGAVAEYPAPRPRRVLPQRQAVYVAVRNADRAILLERRPPSGIWGGLWCLPEAADEAACRAWLQQYWRPEPAVERLDTIEHTFTHFRLQLQPVQVNISGCQQAAVNDSGRYRWCSLDEALGMGLPAPIRTLLEILQSKEKEIADGTYRALRKTG